MRGGGAQTSLDDKQTNEEGRRLLCRPLRNYEG
jgi:hypothetical protein